MARYNIGLLVPTPPHRDNPAGVAWVTVVVVTSPTRLPRSRAMVAIGVSFVPSGSTLTQPLRICAPDPRLDAATEESVVTESSEAMSIKP